MGQRTVSAGTLDPETGASTKRPPLPRTASENSTISLTCHIDKKTNTEYREISQWRSMSCGMACTGRACVDST
jgi:hypothetical protein